MSVILQMSINQWIAVKAENEADKFLVSDEQRKQWENFEAKTTERLKIIVEGYEGGEISKVDIDWLRNLDDLISRAERIDRSTLEARHADQVKVDKQREEDERLRKEAEDRKIKDVQEQKMGLLDKLGF